MPKTFKPVADEEIDALKQANDPDRAFKFFNDRCRDGIIRLCKYKGLQHQDAEDIASDVILKLVQNYTTLDRNFGSFNSWLNTTIEHQVADHFRRQKKRSGGYGYGGQGYDVLLANFISSRTSGDPDELSEQSHSRQLIQDKYEAALAAVQGKTTPRIWTAFCQTTIEGRPDKDVAEELGTLPATVRVWRHRIIKKLQDACKEHNIEPGLS